MLDAAKTSPSRTPSTIAPMLNSLGASVAGTYGANVVAGVVCVGGMVMREVWGPSVRTRQPLFGVRRTAVPGRRATVPRAVTGRSGVRRLAVPRAGKGRKACGENAEPTLVRSRRTKQTTFTTPLPPPVTFNAARLTARRRTRHGSSPHAGRPFALRRPPEPGPMPQEKDHPSREQPERHDHAERRDAPGQHTHRATPGFGERLGDRARATLIQHGDRLVQRHLKRAERRLPFQPLEARVVALDLLADASQLLLHGEHLRQLARAPREHLHKT